MDAGASSEALRMQYQLGNVMEPDLDVHGSRLDIAAARALLRHRQTVPARLKSPDDKTARLVERNRAADERWLRRERNVRVTGCNRLAGSIQRSTLTRCVFTRERETVSAAVSPGLTVTTDASLRLTTPGKYVTANSPGAVADPSSGTGATATK